MKNKHEILVELADLSPVLYQLRSQGIAHFKVPDSYFNELAADVHSHVDSGLADGIGKNVFEVPENYFTHLKDDIFAGIESGLSEDAGKQSFDVPTGYFDGLADNVMNKVEAGESRVIDLNSRRKREKLRPFRLWAMVAAVAALIILTLRIPAFTPSDAFSSADALKYLEEHYMQFESAELYALADFDVESFLPENTEEIIDEMNIYLEYNIDELEEFLLLNEI